MDVETQLRGTNELVTNRQNPPEAPELGLMDGSVISVKEEWSFVVGNLGEKQGVKIGMPMRVMRDDRKIADGAGSSMCGKKSAARWFRRWIRRRRKLR